MKNKNYFGLLMAISIAILTAGYWLRSDLKSWLGAFAAERCVAGSDRVPVEGSQNFSLPIVQKLGGVPVVEVSINGLKILAIFDTGASHTLITPATAKQLKLQSNSTQAAETAQGKVNFPLATIERLQFGRAEVKDLQVSIADRDLQIGLLGQDVFGDYEITIGKNSIHFRKFTAPLLPPPNDDKAQY